MRVRVDPARIAAMGVSMEDVRTAIANSNAVGPIGTFDGASVPSPLASTTSCAPLPSTTRWW